MATTNDSFLVADTSGLISLANTTDRNHEAALSAARSLEQDRQAILIPYDVFAETINVAGKRLGHANAVKLASYLLETPLFVVVSDTSQITHEALDRMSQLPESVSFTDCVVMSFADQYGTKRIFGFDGAFTQNGYRITEQLEEAA